jgi:allantoate deiminase
MIAPMCDAETVLDRCDLLARCSEEPDRLTRRFATPALRQARELVQGWMRDAGLAPRCDPIGNLVGRLDGGGDPALVLGSHLDTVPDAGRYDGALGVLVGVACAERLREAGSRLPFALEVVGFADEEGARYRTAFLGSAVMAGRFEAPWLDRVDSDGVTWQTRSGPGAATRRRSRPAAAAGKTCSATARSTSSRVRCWIVALSRSRS